MSAEQGAGGRGQANAEVIGALLAELDSLGVREFCVCAGARNAPLLDVLARRQDAVLYSSYEERSAAFFALGRVMQTRTPAAVITTSGTAVAELLPAVMEAYYQALPLVVVTADRPSRYRGSGAPQAVEQRGIFGTYAVCEMELEAAGGCRMVEGGTRRDGPIHVNVCLEEGLCADDTPGRSSVPEGKTTPWREGANAHSETQRREWREFWEADGDLLILASGIHPQDVPHARSLLLKLAAPVVAEATSNLCGDEGLRPLLVHGGERALKMMRPKRVLRLGAVPSWRWWRDLDARDDVRVLNVTRSGFRGLARTERVSTVPWEAAAALQSELQISDCPTAVDRSGALLECLGRHPHSEPSWVRQISRKIGAGAAVFLGNSLPIREWNLAAYPPKAGTKFFANRGANGIDGLVSTWLGVAAEEAESWLVVGDLSALYDLGAPWILPQLRGAKRRIVVINNGGGQIFSRVAWLKQAGPETKRMMNNPHALSFEPWARLWGMDYRLLTDVGQLEDDAAACAVWEVKPDVDQTEAFWSDWQA